MTPFPMHHPIAATNTIATTSRMTIFALSQPFFRDSQITHSVSCIEHLRRWDEIKFLRCSNYVGKA